MGGRTAFSAFAGESADFAFGVGWDMMVHGDSFNNAFTANLIGVGVGGVIGGVGGVIGRGLRSSGGDAVMDV